ncbi:hypothetical protein LFM09_31555 [Lentzea alba]|uniref:hypothetical protein n=1 Tax=Lentzea alba TaxID=2714351 RepID=UPI0039BF11AE
MSETPVRKVPETRDPASATLRPSTPAQQQQPVPPQQQSEQRHDQRHEQRVEQRQEQRSEQRPEQRQEQRHDQRLEQRPDQERPEQDRPGQDRPGQERPGQRHEQQRSAGRLEDEWQAVQYEFVDDPKSAVRKADDLVTRAIDELTARHRSLTKQLEGNGDPQTEDLRLALHRYRELFKSLVAVK